MRPDSQFLGLACMNHETGNPKWWDDMRGTPWSYEPDVQECITATRTQVLEWQVHCQALNRRINVRQGVSHATPDWPTLCIRALMHVSITSPQYPSKASNTTRLECVHPSVADMRIGKRSSMSASGNGGRLVCIVIEVAAGRSLSFSLHQTEPFNSCQEATSKIV